MLLITGLAARRAGQSGQPCGFHANHDSLMSARSIWYASHIVCWPLAQISSPAPSAKPTVRISFDPAVLGTSLHTQYSASRHDRDDVAITSGLAPSFASV
jgi:hypothetical protein